MYNQIKIGDQVSVLDENLKGKVVAIAGNTVQLVDEEGFEWTYQLHELVVYHQTELLKETTQLLKPETIKRIINKKHQWIQIGDSVSILDEEILGEVIAIKGKQVIIEDEDFFSRSYPIEKVIIYDSTLLKDTSRVSKSRKEKESKAVFTTSSIVDLHNEDPYLPKNKILKNQIKLFKEELNQAIRKGQTQITFIHGKGEGVLKQELKNILSKNKIKYKKAPYRKFGQGALIVLLTSNHEIV